MESGNRGAGATNNSDRRMRARGKAIREHRAPSIDPPIGAPDGRPPLTEAASGINPLLNGQRDSGEQTIASMARALAESPSLDAALGKLSALLPSLIEFKRLTVFVRHGGAISLTSTPGKGSCFEVEIPEAQPGPSPAHIEKMAQIGPPAEPVSRFDELDKDQAHDSVAG